MSVIFRRAKTEEELDSCYRLRYEVYSSPAVDFLDPADAIDKREFDKFDLSTAVNFMGIDDDTNHVFGTIRCIPDSSMGLPIEEIYDLSSLRCEGRFLGELSRRINTSSWTKGIGILKIGFQYAQAKGITDIVCSMQKEHERFFQKMGMRRFGEEKYYPKLECTLIGLTIDWKSFKPPYDRLILEKSDDIILD